MDIKMKPYPVLCIFLPLMFFSCGDGSGPEQTASKAETEWELVPFKQLDQWVEGKELRRNVMISDSKKSSGARFYRRNGPSIGVNFRNRLNNENIKNYLFSGAGLSVGDYDNNGLPDLFMVSQDGPNKLFRQKAPWQFEDVTEEAGIVDTESWGSGAAFADINGDGQLDLYVCNKGNPDEIYMNQGKGTFSGGFVGGSKDPYRAPTMVAFADYDRDGDLDFYRTSTRLISIKEMFKGKVLTKKDNSGIVRAHPSQADQFEMIDGLPRELGTHDRLFRNDGVGEGGMPKLVDVTRDSGINIAREHGLSAVWWDYNDDGWPDLYVSNDFHTPDHLYRNNGDSTFEEVTKDALAYTSWYSMGSDFADINNDGRLDYLSSDMSATTHFKQKTMMGAMTDTAWFLDNLEPRQYMRNVMHVNTGTGKFIDVAFHAGIDSTDWTWAAIFGDLDNDGLEDIFFTNGIERNVQDADQSIRMRQAGANGATVEELRKIFLDSPRLKEKNLAFRNRGNFKFEKSGDDWGLNEETVSHGAVLSDLDRDGDLDVVVNNMNDPVGIYMNLGNNSQKGASSHSHRSMLIYLKGIESNYFGLGARLTLKMPNGQLMNRIMTSSRGYMSGAEPVIHFGWPSSWGDPEELIINWPSGHLQKVQNIVPDWHYRITESGTGTTGSPDKASNPKARLFSQIDEALGINFIHSENFYDDFTSQPLLPNRLSRFGPALAIGDVDSDGDKDVFIGAARDRQSALFIQNKKGQFSRVACPALKVDQIYEDVDALWFDSDNDGDQDLYVVSGGASQAAGHEHYQDRLYLNDGSGQLSRAPKEMLPDLNFSGSRAAAHDIDRDGDLDLFIGSRFVPGKYPIGPESVLLINEAGRFSKVQCSAISSGMVTDVKWSDIDGDKRADLILATEWGPVRVYQNKEDGFHEITESLGLDDFTGWWNCVVAGDVDQDGDNDIIAGNFGTNTKYSVSKEKPATIFAADFGGTGTLQLVEAQYKEGKLLPVRGRSCSTTAMPHLVDRVPTYSSFASKTIREIYTPQAIKESKRLEVNTLSTMLFRNDGKGKFIAEPLPLLSQMAPVMDIVLTDVNRDGRKDIALAQNFNAAQRETGRMNAGLGVILISKDNGQLDEIWPDDSGFFSRADPRRLIATDLDEDGTLEILLGQNGGDLQIFRSKHNFGFDENP